jgi:hypothetical protein
MNPAGGGVDISALAGELEQIRKRGVRWLDGDGRQDRLDSFPQIEKLAGEFAARQGREQLTRWQAVDLLLRAAVARPEAAPARDRLVRLYGFSDDLWGTSSVDLAHQLRTSEKISAKTFQRRNSTSRHCLAEAVSAILDEPQQTGPSEESPVLPQPEPRATPAPASAAEPAGIAGLLGLALATGVGAALVMGLADDLTYLTGLAVLLAGWLAGFRVPLRILLPISLVLTGVLFANLFGHFWPIDPADGLLSGYLAATPFGYAFRHIARLIRQLGGGEFVNHWFVAILTSVFWLGLGATLFLGAGTGTPLGSALWATFAAAVAVGGFVAFRRTLNRR